MPEIQLPTKSSQDDIKRNTEDILASSGKIIDIDGISYKPIMIKDNYVNETIGVSGGFIFGDLNYIYILSNTHLTRVERSTGYILNSVYPSIGTFRSLNMGKPYAQNEDHIFLIEAGPSNNHFVRKISKNTFKVVASSSQFTPLNTMVLDGNHLYIGTDYQSPVSARVWELDSTTLEHKRSVVLTKGYCWGLTVDENYIYSIDGDGNGCRATKINKSTLTITASSGNFTQLKTSPYSVDVSENSVTMMASGYLASINGTTLSNSPTIMVGESYSISFEDSIFRILKREKNEVINYKYENGVSSGGVIEPLPKEIEGYSRKDGFVTVDGVFLITTTEGVSFILKTGNKISSYIEVI